MYSNVAKGIAIYLVSLMFLIIYMPLKQGNHTSLIVYNEYYSFTLLI